MTDQPASNNGSLILGIIAGLIAAAMGVGVWMAFYKIGSSGFALLTWLSGPVIGLLVGLTMRWAGKTCEPAISIVAIILTLIACVVGHILTDIHLVPWTPPSDLPQAIKNLGNDIQAWLLIAIGCYIAFALVRRPSRN